MADEPRLLFGTPGAPQRIALVGIPYDAAQTLGRPGARYAPAEVRKYLEWSRMRIRENRVYDVTAGRMVSFAGVAVEDHGDVPIAAHDHLRVLDTARAKVEELLAGGAFVITVGGDDSTTIAGLGALAGVASGPLELIMLDAHLDLVDENFRQGKYSGSSPARRALEMGPYRPERLVQIGVRGFNYPDQFEFIQAQGIRHIPAAAVHARGAAEAARQALEWAGDGGIFLSLDVDALDPAFAPGSGWDEPGGLTSAQVLELVRLLAPRARVFNVVETNPAYDRNGVTANLVALCIFTAIAARAADGAGGGG